MQPPRSARIPMPPAVQAAMAAIQADRLEDAAQGLRAAMAEGGDPRWPRMLVTLLTEMNRLEEAAKLARDLVQGSAGDASLLLVLGDLERGLGHRSAARKAYRKALKADAGNGRALWSLVFYGLEEPGPALEKQARDGLERAGNPQARALMHFGLAECVHARGDYSAAFPHFDAGNALLRPLEPFDPRMLAQEVAVLCEDMAQVCDASAADDAPAPVFLMGMPRSGSTLLETMLGRHADIEPIGESRGMARLVARHIGAHGPSPERLAALGRSYIAGSAARRREDTPLFIDKMHLNWRFAPLILRAIPNARIIDLRRDAMDCCWSNFRFPFQGGHPASCDQRAIAQFYRACAQVLDAAESRTSARVLSLAYEDLVAQPETCLRAICDWLDIAYDAKLLVHDAAPNAVAATASSEQVRQPVNRKGLGVHEPYRQWLGPMAEALGG